MRSGIVAIFLVLGAALASEATGADPTPAETVRAGNDLLRAGDFEGAEEAYRKVLDESGESAPILYNLGNVAHARGEWREAEASYRGALDLLLGTPGLERRILFNLGNNAYRRGLEEVDADLEQGLETLKSAAVHFQEVIGKTRDIRNPDESDLRMLEDAKFNLEVVRLRIKAILDEIKKKMEEENRPDLVRRVAALVDGQRQVTTGLEAVALDLAPEPAREGVIEAVTDLQSRLVDGSDEVISLMDEMLAAPVPAPPGGAGTQPGVPAGPTGPPPNLEPARESLDTARQAQSEALESIPAAGAPESGPLAGVAVDRLVDTLGILDPLVGLEKRAEAEIDFEERNLAVTGRLAEGTSSVDRFELTRREGENRTRSDRAIAHVDALDEAAEASAGGGGVGGGLDPAAGAGKALDRTRESLAAIREELRGAAGRQEAARGYLEGDRPSEATGEQQKALAHLRAALEKIRDLSKTWAELLEEAVKLQERVVFETESAASAADDAEGDAACGRAEEFEAGAIAVTDRSLEGLRETIAQAAMAAAASGGAPAQGEAADPALQEIERLVAEARVDEEIAAGELNRRNSEGALPPAASALAKLREALEKARERMEDRQQEQQQQGNQGQQDESGEEQGEPERDPGESENETNEGESEQDREGEPPPRDPKEDGSMSPEEAKKRLGEMQARQEKERDRARAGQRVRRVPVEKDW